MKTCHGGEKKVEDSKIVELYWARAEAAIAESERKYGKYCYTIAHGILRCREDSEECVNDTYLQAWNTIPPERPTLLGAYLCRITRNLAINRYRADRRDKRGGGQTALALEELSECVSDGTAPLSDEVTLRQAINAFLRALPDPARTVFVQRYWYVRPVADIAEELGMNESRVKMILHRTRNRLREHLSKEGIQI